MVLKARYNAVTVTAIMIHAKRNTVSITLPPRVGLLSDGADGAAACAEGDVVDTLDAADAAF